MDQILKPIKQAVNVGIIVKNDDKLIYEYNSKHLFTPASLIKLYTAYSSLKYLGSEYKYTTRIYIDKSSKDISNLYIKFSGDPTFKSTDLENLLNKLNQLGINNINNVIIDDSQFDNILHTEGNTLGDEAYCFAAPISAIIIDKNCFKVKIEDQGNSIKLKLEDKTGSIHIRNSLIISNEYIDWTSTILDDVYNLQGSFKKSQLPKTIKLAYQNPRLLAKNLITSYLNENKISVKGKIDFGITPNILIPAFVHESPTLKEIVRELLKNSDNLIAESLVRTISYNYYKLPGSNNLGIKAILEILSKENIDTEKFRLADGVGSYYSLISPESIVELLYIIRKDSEIYPYIFSSLPIMGVDGTLENYQYSKLKGKIFAKTGTLKSAANLAGYAVTDKGNKINFAIMFNDFIIPKKELLNVYEQLLDYIVTNF
ncbi:MAG: D-alanyl-D-alanine carboxypeptidase/D-alanyl-D-alanine-endopeptidase [Alphaproteobacteria bacterium]